MCGVLSDPGRDLRVLATIREALDLDGEWVHQLERLPTVPPTATASAADSLAAQLFLTRDQL